MSLIGIYNANGNQLSAHSLGLFGLKLDIPAPSYNITTESVDGMGGVIVIGNKLNPRRLNAEFSARSGNYEDSIRLRDELFTILSNGSEIYVSETYRPGKRWKVYPLEWTPDRINSRVQKFDIPLLAPSGLSESINQTKKKYTVTNFRFRNEGSQPIDMRTQEETEITFIGASSGLSIHNRTTGDTWSYNGTTTPTDVITLKGVRSLKNGESIFRDTNKKMIDFAIGNNEFEISGVNGVFELSIATRFYFL